MKTKTKTIIVTDFDPVKMMRDIRDQLKQEIMGMTFEQEQKYLKQLLTKGNHATL